MLSWLIVVNFLVGQTPSPEQGYKALTTKAYVPGQFPRTVVDDEGWLHTGDLGLVGADGAAKPWHYLVVDVKFSTLDLSVNGYAGSSHRHYAGQVLVYTEAIARMQQVCAEAITDAKVREKLDAAGAVLVANSPADFKTWLDGQREVLGALIKSADIKLG